MNIPMQLILMSFPSLIYIAVQKRREKKWGEVLGQIGWNSSALKYYLWSIGVVILVAGLDLPPLFGPLLMLDSPPETDLGQRSTQLELVACNQVSCAV
jgi:hypothetical protein